MYEGATNQGPISSGAAGTERFDSDRVRGASGATGATGTTAAAGAAGATGLTGTAGTAAAQGAGGPGYGGYDQQDTTQRAEGKSSGGIAGIVSYPSISREIMLILDSSEPLTKTLPAETGSAKVPTTTRRANSPETPLGLADPL